MEEKYYIINVADDFLLVIKCNKTKLEYYLNFGNSVCKAEDGIMNLQILSEWLICHNIYHRAILLPKKNIFKKMYIRHYIYYINHRASYKNVVIKKKEINNMIFKVSHGGEKCCWNFSYDGK